MGWDGKKAIIALDLLQPGLGFAEEAVTSWGVRRSKVT